MRSTFLVAVACLAIGILGALGYSHYLGEGRQLADLQDQLATSTASLAKATKESREAKIETAAMSAQIQQLNTTKEDLTHQVAELKSTASLASPPASTAMAGIMKGAMAQHVQQQLLLLKSRLHLTPEQEAEVKTALEEESKRGEEMTAKMMAGGKIDPNEFKGAKTIDQALNDILNPDQKTAYQQMKADQKNSAVEMMASVEMNQMGPLLQLSDSQKDQVYSALCQSQLNSQDPNWIKANAGSSANPAAFLEAQAKAKEDALAKILTPDQLATYHQQAQSQLDMQKAMMQKFTPSAPASVPASAPAPASSTP